MSGGTLISNGAGERVTSSTPSGWQSFGSSGEESIIQSLVDGDGNPAGNINWGGRGGGATGISGDPARGLYIFDQCLATGGSGSVRKIKQTWRTEFLAIASSEHKTATGCADPSRNSAGSPNSSIINQAPAANTGSGGAFYRNASSTAGIAGASGTIIIRYSYALPSPPTSITL
jgi:hypothetical protein